MTEDINYEIIEALSQIARERNLKREIVFESLEIGLLTAAKRALGTLDPVEVDVDKETGSISLGIVKEVVATVDDVTEPLLQIPLDQAKKLDPETEVGWHLYVDVPVTAFGRTAIQAAKQVLQQRIREAERDKIFEEYLDREREIVTGSVQQVTRGTILVNIGRVEAILPYREQIRRERFRQGDTIRALVKEVTMDTKGPSIILSRADEEFVRKLFAIEVPEIYEGIVEIKKITRAPGERCKVAVRSHDLRVDAVGACVGMKGSRVQSIVRELNNERIDIVPWSPDVTFFITKAIGPAKVSRVLIDDERKELTLIMPEDQIALALGPGGTNARLAGELVNYHIDVVSESDYDRALKEVEGIYQRIGELDITAHQVELLRAGGVEYVQDLQSMTPDEIQAIPGIGPAIVKTLVEALEAFTGEPYVPPEREPEIEAEEEAEEPERVKETIDPVRTTTVSEVAEGLDETEWIIDTDILRRTEAREESTSPIVGEDTPAEEIIEKPALSGKEVEVEEETAPANEREEEEVLEAPALSSEELTVEDTASALEIEEPAAEDATSAPEIEEPAVEVAASAPEIEDEAVEDAASAPEVKDEEDEDKEEDEEEEEIAEEAAHPGENGAPPAQTTELKG